MPTRARTFTERLRREQLIGVTVDLVAGHGYRGTSLQQIATAAAGISKAAVLYHFPSKDAVIAAAYEHVIGELVTHVASAVGAAPDPFPAVEVYHDTMLGHLAAHPSHARLVAEALPDDRGLTEDAPSSPRRWEAQAGLIEAAQRIGRAGGHVDPRTASIMLNGVVDALVGAGLQDPEVRIDDARPAVRDLVQRLLAP